MQETRLICSRAPAGSMTRAGPVSRTGLAPTGENSFDLRGLACIAQTRQDPERGDPKDPNLNNSSIFERIAPFVVEGVGVNVKTAPQRRRPGCPSRSWPCQE